MGWGWEVGGRSAFVRGWVVVWERTVEWVEWINGVGGFMGWAILWGLTVVWG